MTTSSRTPDADVHPMFLDRWSPRAIGPGPLTDAQLATLFEAMRWAPSCFNEQPWLVVYATDPGSPDHQRLTGVLVEANQIWAGRAALLMILFARRRFSHNANPNRHAGFDCGAAWMSLALEARALGLYATRWPASTPPAPAPTSASPRATSRRWPRSPDRKSTRLNSSH